ncbi:MAG: glycosyltransferase family 4 protein [Anaerolineales bacterium]
MRIGIDAGCWGNRRGFGRFTRCLVSEMVARDERNDYVMVVDEPTLADPACLPLPAGAEHRVAPVRTAPARAAAAAGSRAPLDLARMAWAASRARCDVFFFPATYSWFPVLGAPIVVTIHDAIAEQMPELTLASRADRLRWWLKQSAALRQARLVVTVSEASRQAVKANLGVPEERLRVVREAAAPGFKPLGPRQRHALLSRFGLGDQPYLLYVGGISPHKNLAVLIDAFSKVALDHPGVRLVLAGDRKDDPFLSSAASVGAAAASSPACDRIHFTGFVTDAELVALYGGAVATALPSLAEGFGLTAAESSACGTPVVASRDAALVELLGDAGLYGRADSPADFAEHFDRLLADPSHRESLCRAVLARSATWSWARAADDTVAILEEVSRG